MLGSGKNRTVPEYLQLLEHDTSNEILDLQGWTSIPAQRLQTHLQHNIGLKRLSLAACQLGDVGVQSILCPALTLGYAPLLEHLNLSANIITDVGAVALCQAMVSSSTTNNNYQHLRELLLSWNAIADAGAVALANLCRSVPSLLKLELDGIDQGPGGGARNCVLGTDQLVQKNHAASSTNIGDEGCMALALVLSESNLVYLNLSRQSRISSRGIVALAEHVASGTTRIKHLELQRTPVDDEGAMALAKAMRHLETLCLMINHITDRGALALAKAIAASDSIVNLGLTQNEIGVVGLAALAEAVKVNTTLLRADLHGNAGGKAGKTIVWQVKPWLRFNRSTQAILRQEHKDLYPHVLAKAASIPDKTRLYKLLRQMSISS